MDLKSAVFQSQEIQDLFSPSRGMSVRLLKVKIISADERIAGKLDVAAGDRAIYIERLILTADRPSFYHREYLVYDPGRPIIEAEMEVTSLQGLFNGTGSKILKRGEMSIEAAIMDEEEANVLGKPWPTPAIRLEHVFYDFAEKPVSWGWFTCSNECLRLTTSVGLGKDF
jgi:GntR family transcriptional regulator